MELDNAGTGGNEYRNPDKSSGQRNFFKISINSVKKCLHCRQLGSSGTVTLSSLLATPFRTWISGPEMVEAHYRSAVGSDPTLVVWFHVRLYKGGQIWIRTAVENGYVNVATTDKVYVPNVTVNGV